MDVLEGLAPPGLAEPWDKVGLHVGDSRHPGGRGQNVRRGLLCIDLTEGVLAEAKRVKADLVVAYHPPIFEPLDRVTTEAVKSRIVYEAVRAGIAVYSPHTALDAAEGGVNDWLAEGLGKGEVRPIRPASIDGGYKLTVFVPPDAADRVRAALAAAGAGVIGDYTQCSFTSAGEGTFLGGKSTNPAVGRSGRLERVIEFRLETVCPGARIGAAIDAIRATHPYEEPAYDVYPLAEGQSHEGQGRVVTLDRAISLDELVRRIKRRTGVKHVEVAKATGGGRVRTVGLCAGAGGSLLDEVGPPAAAGAMDAFFTGEMRHHGVLDAVARGIHVVLVGHTQTERPYLKVYRRRIIAAGADKVEWSVSRADKPPSRLV